MSAYLVHVGYGMMLCALMARDVLWLRATLVAAQSVLAGYAWTIGVKPIAAWNALFVLINAVWVVRIARERRAVVLPADLAELQERYFAAMAPGEFLRFWELGDAARWTGAQLATQGEYPASLYFLTAGRATVVRDGVPVATLGPGQFAAEMSLVTGAPANATVTLDGVADLRVWPVARVRDIRAGQPELWSRLQAVLGMDLVEKIRRGDDAGA